MQVLCFFFQDVIEPRLSSRAFFPPSLPARLVNQHQLQCIMKALSLARRYSDMSNNKFNKCTLLPTNPLYSGLYKHWLILLVWILTVLIQIVFCLGSREISTLSCIAEQLSQMHTFVGIYRARVLHLVKACMKGWIGSLTISLTR